MAFGGLYSICEFVFQRQVSSLRINFILIIVSFI